MNKVLTLNDFINELGLQRDKLSNNLKSMGIQTDIDNVKEKFNTLIEKVLEISVNSGLTDEELSQTTATEDKVLNGFTFYSGNKTIKTGTALSSATTVDKTKLLKDITAYDNNGNLITGTALSKETNVAAAKMFKGVTAYNNLGELITGNPTSTNVTSSKMFKGVTAYNSNGTLITGSPTATTVSASDIAKGEKAYTSSGTLLTGTGTLISGTAYKVYTGEVTANRSTVYLSNIKYAMFGTSGLSSGDGISYAGGTAGAVNNYHVQVILNYGQVIDAGYITITSSYISYEPGYVNSLDYVAFCEV